MPNYEELKDENIEDGLDGLILPRLQKELEGIYLDRLLWMKQLKSDPVHNKLWRPGMHLSARMHLMVKKL